MDVRSIRQLAEVMSQYDLLELDLEQNESRVHLVKEGSPSGNPIPCPKVPREETMNSLQATERPSFQESDESCHQIKAPLVGTFCRSSNDDVSEFVTEGSHVEKGDVVCIIEAMKVMNEIKSDKAGTITRVLVEDKTPVEFGQPLFELKEDL